MAKTDLSGTDHQRCTRPPGEELLLTKAAVRRRYSPGNKGNSNRAGSREKANTEVILAADRRYCCHQAAAAGRGCVCAYGHVAPGQIPDLWKSPPTRVPACTET